MTEMGDNEDMTTTTNPSQMWCIDCDRWTPVADNSDYHGGFEFCCDECGEPYHCDECGYDVDRAGNCQRPEGHAGDDPEIPEYNPGPEVDDEGGMSEYKYGQAEWFGEYES